MAEIRIDSTGRLESMTDAQLLRAYNDVCGTEDKVLPVPPPQAIERILKVLAVRTKTPKVKSKAGRPHVRFDYPAKLVQHYPKAGSARAKVLEMAKQCTTVRQVGEQLGLTDKQAYNYLRQLHTELGYALREDADGNIKASA